MQRENGKLLLARQDPLPPESKGGYFIDQVSQMWKVRRLDRGLSVLWPRSDPICGTGSPGSPGSPGSQEDTVWVQVAYEQCCVQAQQARGSFSGRFIPGSESIVSGYGLGGHNQPMRAFFRGRTTNQFPDVVLSKGINNYCCQKALAQVKRTDRNAASLDRVAEWLKHTTTADFEESGAPTIDYSLEEQICVGRCAPGDCTHAHTCPYKHMRDRRSWCNGIIITNHNQLVNDLEKRREGDLFGLWPEPVAIIIDEAHALEGIVRSEHTFELSTSDLANLVMKAIAQPVVVSTYTGAECQRMEGQVEALKYALEQSVEPPDDEAETHRRRIKRTNQLCDALGGVQKTLGSLSSTIQVSGEFASVEATLKARSRRESSYGSDLATLLDDAASTIEDVLTHMYAEPAESTAVWAETSSEEFSIHVAPLDVGPFLKEALWNIMVPIVLTSGTLATSADFTYYRKAMGLERNSRVVEHIAEPVSDYEKSVRIYVPTDLPPPTLSNEAKEDNYPFTSQMCQRLKEMIDVSKGRALALFTSYRRMAAARDYLKANGCPYTILTQGDYPTGELSRRFRTETHSVLLATGSFWEGFDAVGESLVLLVMDKLPFPNPNDPLTDALAKRAEARSEDPRATIYIPEMLKIVRQGSGRLIRHEDDMGVIALLDTRARGQYQSLLRGHLPPVTWTSDLADISEWFASVDSILHAIA